MSTSQYTFHPFHTIGAASVFLWDPSAGGGGAWRPLGKVADAAVLITTEQAGKNLTLKGLTQPIARRNRAKRYSLTFRLLEDAGPLTLDLLFSDGAAQAPEAGGLVRVSETLRLYGGDYTELGHPYGIRSTPPEGVSGLSGSAGGSGGTVPPGSYYYWVAPLYVTEQAGLVPGAPVRSNQVTVTTGEKVTLTFTPPQGTPPAGYWVLYGTTTSLSGAMLLPGTFAGSPALVSSHAGASAPGATVFVEPLSVSSYDGQTLYDSGDDYLAEVEKGLVKRVDGGAVADGEAVVVTYVYERPASVVTSLGDAVDLERHRMVKLLQLAPADRGELTDLDPASWRETGVEFVFYKVNVALNDSRWPFSEDDFSEGASITWDCLFDGAQAKVGTVRSTYGVLAEYV
jgi:hypothetical protein